MVEEEGGRSRPREASDDDSAATEPDEARPAGDDGAAQDISDTPAPSIGPHTVMKREPPKERLPRHDQSDVDAMGHDKRRQVVGKTYGPTFARQAVLYLVFVVVVVGIGFGVKLLVDHYDAPPKHFKAEAPWAQPHVKQIPPKPLQ
jgi:hypothetical protein